MEMQPVLWRMSKRDGKATLLKATLKKHVHQLEVADYLHEQCKEVAAACPVKIIKT
jgi:ferredoxin